MAFYKYYGTMVVKTFLLEIDISSAKQTDELVIITRIVAVIYVCNYPEGEGAAVNFCK